MRALKLGFKQNADMISLKLLIYMGISIPHESMKFCLTMLKHNLKEFRMTLLTQSKEFVQNLLKNN